MMQITASQQELPTGLQSPSNPLHPLPLLSLWGCCLPHRATLCTHTGSSPALTACESCKYVVGQPKPVPAKRRRSHSCCTSFPDGMAALGKAEQAESREVVPVPTDALKGFGHPPAQD